jgi:DNA invertase Pin-like site-specific DNA recombinase
MKIESVIRKDKLDKTGWGYLRVSTTAQAEVQHGSLEQQRHMLERWAVRESERVGCNYQLTRIIEEDISGRAASLHKRRGYHELVCAVKTGNIDFVVFEKIDRLNRDKIENQLFVEMCDDHGVEVYEVESGLINLRDRGNRLGFHFKNFMAEEYSLDLAEKITKKQREAKFNNGKDSSTTPILGLDPHPTKTGFYTINIEEQLIINDIFRHFVSSGSLKVTSDYCNEKGYRTKVRYTREKIDREGNRIPPCRVGGEKFGIQNLKLLLQNPKFRGYDFFKDTWNQFTHKQDENGLVRWNYSHGPVVDEWLFERVQRLLSNNKKCHARGSKQRRSYLLSGILITPDRIKFHGESAKSGQNPYYVNKKHKISIPADKIEGIVIDYIERFYKENGIWEKVLNDTLRDKNQKLYLVTEEIARLKRMISEKETYVETLRNSIYEASKISPDAMVQAALKLSEEEKRIQEELQKLREDLNVQRDRQNLIDTRLRQDVVAKHVNECLEKFRNGDSIRRKQIVQALVREIEVRPDNRLEIRLNPWASCDKDEKVRVCEGWRER